MADEQGSFRVDGKTYSIAQDADLGEITDAEDAFGIDMATATTMKKTMAIMWISIKRVNPDVEIDEIRGIPLSVVSEIAEEADAVPPAVKPGEPKSISGERSAATSEVPAGDPSLTGDPGLDTGLVLARETFFAALQPN